MANIVYNVAKLKIANGALDLDTSVIKVMLLGVAPSGGAGDNPDTATVSAVLANATELVPGAGYAAGPGGSGRKTLVVTATQDNTNDRVNVSATALTWTAITSGTHTQIVGYLLYLHISGTDDSLNFPIQYINASPFVAVPLNGSDITLPAGDWLQF